MKKILKMNCMLLITVIIGYLLLVLVYSLPINTIQKHVKHAVKILANEGTYHKISDAKLDNHSDAIMLLTAAYDDANKPIYSALYTTHERVEGMDGRESLLSLFDAELHDKSEINKINYSRYWHGYLVFLKPLSLIMDYCSIRNVISIIQLLLFGLILCTMVEKNLNELIFPTFILYAFFNPLTTMASLHYNSVIVITFFATLLVLKTTMAYKYSIYFFAFIGSLTSYFDLSTTPLLTLGIPLIIWMYLYNTYKIKTNFCGIVKNCLCWGYGWLFMWCGKWILATIIIKENIILDAIQQIVFRASNMAVDGEKISFYDIMKTMISTVCQGTWIVLFIAYCLYLILKSRKEKVQTEYLFNGLILSSLPIIWMILVKNHTYTHFFFTYRILGISLYAIMITFCSLFISKRDTKKNE